TGRLNKSGVAEKGAWVRLVPQFDFPYTFIAQTGMKGTHDRNGEFTPEANVTPMYQIEGLAPGPYLLQPIICNMQWGVFNEEDAGPPVQIMINGNMQADCGR